LRSKHARQAVRVTLARLGLHATPRAVLDELARYGMHVSEELVRSVRLEMVRGPAEIVGRSPGRAQVR
jgi:hypothetical protein